MGNVRPNRFCLQGFDELDMIEYECSYSDCRRCGHNENVAKYRKHLIDTYGLKKGDDGLYRFIIPKRSRGNGGKKA